MTLPAAADIALQALDAPEQRADGGPVAGALVVTSLGGQTVTDVGPSAGAPARARTVVVEATAGCEPSWLPTFGGSSSLDGIVFALAVFDDGGGPALYAGGAFQAAGGVAAARIAKWDGSAWSPLGSGMNDYVQALAVFDDGSGPALYAGGWFTSAGGVGTNRVAKWDGSTWSSFEIVALAAFDDGLGGAALHVGGNFTAAFDSGDSYLAKWGCPAIASLPGCAGNLATLEALASGAPLGAPLPLRVTGSAAASGLGQVYFGAYGLDAGGCGLLVPGIGELLLALAPTPSLVASGILAGGVCDVAPPVPSTPALSGVTAHLQGLALDLALASPIEPTNALAVTLGP